MLDFTEKTALVTGAGAGIGLACAKAFAAAGARVALCDIDGASAKAAMATIGREIDPSRLAAFEGDVGDDADCERLVAETLTRFGDIDVLVNNAGILSPGSVLDLDRAEFDRVLNVNLRGAFVLTQLVGKHLAAKRAGAIVNIASINSSLALQNQAAYVTSKGGLLQLTRASALDLAPFGVRVNAIGPGSVMTDMLKAVLSDETARKKMLSRTPLGRAGAPEEIARVALFLASEMASYITGQIIYPDGGRMALNATVAVDE